MCGIVGFIQKSDHQEAKHFLELMIKKIRYRGPDDVGVWYGSDDGIAMAHCRLSILDLTSAGHQPMFSRSGRYVLVYNGEIYNHREIRDKLKREGYDSWAGHSDTETLLVAIDHWGVEKTVVICEGMFAFAVWDESSKELTLVRDRFGEKPLYFGRVNGVFFFSSELKALREHKLFRGDIDPRSLGLYLKYMCIPAPYSIYKDIEKVEPGCIVKVKENGRVEKSSYWSIESVISSFGATNSHISYEDAIVTLGNLFDRSVSDQMIADVPIGAFLSGGVDSSLVTAVMQKHSDSNIHTYSVAFDDDRYDESNDAQAVADYLGTRHSTKHLTGNDLVGVIPELANTYDEPFSDSSQIPTYLVSKFASQDVKVVLTGDGGDELFGGYNRYVLTQKYWQRINKYPGIIRSGISSLIKSVPEESWDRFFGTWGKLLGTAGTVEMAGNKALKAADLLHASNDLELYESLVSIEKTPQYLLATGESFAQTFLKQHYDSISSLEEPIRKIMALDQTVCLPSDILTKVDRAAMANSLESRIPFLNHRIAEYSWSLPFDYLIDKGGGKKIIRDLLCKYIPSEYVDRPKRGFGVPLDQWLRTDLRSWADSLLDKRQLDDQGYFDGDSVRKIWNDHIEGRCNNANRIWSVLMFQSWMFSYGR